MSKKVISVERVDDDWHCAFKWLCEQRNKAPSNADVWDLRFHWESEKYIFYEKVVSGHWILSPMLVTKNNTVMWSARDALVLKWVALKLTRLLPAHDNCQHIKGKGGRKNSIIDVTKKLSCNNYRFVVRNDIKGYYQHIIQSQVFWHIKQYVSCPVLTGIVRQFLWYSIECGGEIRTPETGISRGCSLSPLVGGSLLYHMDSFFSRVFDDIYYVRYMDDFIIMTYTRHRLRQCIRYMNEFFNMRGFEKHPDKTVIGKITRGFDWLGVDFDSNGAQGISYRSIKKHREECLRRYLCSVVYGDSHEESIEKLNQYKKDGEKVRQE